MKKIILLSLIIIAFSCENRINTKLQTNNDLQPRKIDFLLNDIFNKKYSNYKKNDLIKEKALTELSKKTDSLIPLNYLDDIPLKIFYIKKNPHGKGAIVLL